jgi:hypothetical protein
MAYSDDAKRTLEDKLGYAVGKETAEVLSAAAALSGDEAAFIDGVVAGVAAANKAVVLDANLDVGTLRHLSISGNLITGATTLSETDLAKIDGITNGTVVANKAVVPTTSRVVDQLTITTLTAPTISGATAFSGGEVTLDGNTNNTAGVGATGGAGGVFRTSVVKSGSLITTQIFIDLTGLNGGASAGDIIGVNGAGAAHLGQITAALNGTIIAGTVTCLEVPTTSDPDVDLWAANEATGIEDDAISGLTGEAQLTNGGDHTLARTICLTAFPTANQYLYLTGGDTTAGTYDAGKFLITLYGYDA